MGLANVIAPLDPNTYSKCISISLAANSSVNFDVSQYTKNDFWAFLVSVNASQNAYYQLDYVKGYVTASRSVIVDLAKNTGTAPISITGSTANKTYTIANNLGISYQISITMLSE